MLLTTLTALSAFAADITLPIAGHLTDGANLSFEGTHDVTFVLRDGPAPGSTQLFSATAAIVFVEGRFAALIGPSPQLTPSDFAGDAWLSVGVDGGPESAPVLLAHAPRAAWAEHAAVASALVGGVQWTALEGVPSGFLDQVDDDHTYTAGAGLSLAGNGEFSIPTRGVGASQIGSASAPSGHQLIADGAGGVTFAARPAPTTAEVTSALGGLSCPTNGVITWSGSAWTCAVRSAPTAAEVAAAIETAPVNGLRIGTSSVCDTNRAGLLRMSAGTLQYCTGTSWASVGVSNVVTVGSARRWSDGTHATSCKTYKTPAAGYQYQGDTGDGRYTIDPDGAGSITPYDVFCDMTNDGGGWTMLLSANGDSTYWGNNAATWWSNASDTNVPTSFGNADHHSPAYSNLTHNETRLCYQNGTKCFNFIHNYNRTLRSFFTDNVTFTAYSENSFGYANVATNAVRSAYLTALGGVTIHTASCWWLGINDQRSISAIGLLGDFNGGCASGGGFHDDLAVGVGLSSCYDNNSCANGGSGHKAGASRGFNNVDNSGVQGPWFVLAR